MNIPGQYTIRHRIFTRSFRALDLQGRVVCFYRLKWRWPKEDLRIFSDESMATELLIVRHPGVLLYRRDVVDCRERRRLKLGAVRPKNKFVWSPPWELTDEDNRSIATLEEEDSVAAIAPLGLMPRRFHLTDEDNYLQASFKARFNLFVYRLEVELTPDSNLDPRLVLAASMLLAVTDYSSLGRA